MKRLIIIFTCFVLISSVFAYPVSAQADESDIITWINLDGGEEYEEEVREWVNSEESESNEQLRDEAEEWLNDREEQEAEVNDSLNEASVIVSDDVRISGYDFDRQNETVAIQLEVDSTTNVFFQDIGSTSTDGGFSFNNERLNAGTHTFEFNSELYRDDTQQLQRFAVVDTSAERGETISYVHSTAFLEEAEVWMIPFSILVGAFTLIGLSAYYVKNKEDEGKGEMIPLE